MKETTEVKDHMFQYACEPYFTKIIEDTGLITCKEANELWDKYYKNCLSRLKAEEKPQMCIWKDCNSTTDYSCVEKEIDYRDDYEIIEGNYYKVTKTKTKI